MIEAEDVHQNIFAEIQRLTPIHGKKVVDLGTGTGRIPILFGDLPAEMIGIDLYGDMLRQNRAVRHCSGGTWDLVQADMRVIPLSPACADIVTAGWSIGHLRAWHPQDWQTQMGRILREMQRLGKRGGMLIILETMTTGSLSPAPPTPELAEYYSWLEQEWGFTCQVLQTDYDFASVEDAVQKTEFFFGKDLAGLIRKNGWSRLPEWTGIWSKGVR